MSLRFRLNLIIAATLLLTVSMGAVFVVLKARRSVLEEIDSSIQLGLQLIEAGRHETNTDRQPIRQWLSQLVRLKGIRHIRIKMEQASGEMLDVSSKQNIESIKNVPAWFVWSVMPEPLEVNKTIEDGSGQARTIIISADPRDEIAEAWGEARGFFGLIVLLAVLVYVFVHITLGRAFRSIGVILKGLEEIESGNYQQRLPDFSSPEFTRISRAFNHTARALEKTQEQNRALTARLLAIQEQERHHLAQELHDELGQSLNAIKVMAVSMRQGIQENETAIGSIISVCDHLFSVVRNRMRRLHPIMLEELGLKASLEDLVENWRSRYPNMAVSLYCDEAIDHCEETTKIHLFRMVQECLTNTVKHASASQSDVRLQVARQTDMSHTANNSAFVELMVSDNGQGFDIEASKKGFGLLGMHERVDSLGGRFYLQSRPGQGVNIKILVPFRAEVQ